MVVALGEVGSQLTQRHFVLFGVFMPSLFALLPAAEHGPKKSS